MRTRNGIDCLMIMNEKILLRGVLGFVIVLLGLSFLFPHEEALLDRSEFSFSTTSDSRLQFNNVRSYWYRRTEIPEQGADKYTYSKWDENMTQSVRPTIINQWRVDEATLFLIPQIGLETSGKIYLKLADDTFAIQLDELDREAHIDIADRWYRHLDTAHSYALLTEEEIEIEVSDTELKGVKTVLKDYFTLVNYLQ